MIPPRSEIRKGLPVGVETKADQGTGRLTHGAVAEILTSSETHPHGIKVRLEDGSVGRVKEIGAGALGTACPPTRRPCRTGPDPSRSG